MNLDPNTQTAYPLKSPVLYLPVRIETKFSQTNQSSRRTIRSSRRRISRNKELRVRIYPDAIGLHKKAGCYSKEEIAAGKKYWATVYLLDIENIDKKRRAESLKNAFAELSKVTGSARGQYLVKKLYNHKGLNENPPEEQWISFKKEIIGLESATASLALINSNFNPISRQAVKEIQKIVVLGKTFHLVSTPCLAGYYGEMKEVWTGYGSRLVQNIKARFKLLGKGRRDIHIRRHSRVESPLWTLLTAKESELLDRLQEEGDLHVQLYNYVQSVLTSIESVQNMPVNTEYGTDKLFPFTDIEENEEGWLPHVVYEAMPDRYVVHILDNDGNIKLSVPGKKISITEEDLADYLPHEGENGTAKSTIKPGWMFDYALAESVGMGITVSINSRLWSQLGAEIPRLVVIGEQLEPHNSTVLQDLIEGQSDVVDQLGFTQPGTPTNNRESEKTGVSEGDDHSDDIFAGVVFPYISGEEITTPAPGTDQYQFEKVLGLPEGSCNSFRGGESRSIQRAKSMNGLMGDLTVGSFLFDFWGTVTDSTMLNQTKDFYKDYVIGRGWLPGIRIERQPYGILPITDFTTFDPDFEKHGPKSPLVKGFTFIESLYESCKASADAVVPSKVEMEKSRSPHSYYLGMLNNNPVSQEFNIRSAINAGNRIDTEPFSRALKELVNFQEDDELNADALAATLSGVFDLESFRDSFPKRSAVSAGALQDRLEYCISQSRALNLRYLDTVEPYTGNVVSHDELKNSLELSEGNNYFDWLTQFVDDPLYMMNLSINKADKRVANKDPQKRGGNPIVSSLLFFMARHSLLQMYKREAYGVMQSLGWLNKNRVSNVNGSIVYDDSTRGWGVLFAYIENFVEYPKAKTTTLFKQLRNRKMVDILTGNSHYGEQSIRMAHARIRQYKEYLVEIGSCTVAELKNLFAEQVDLSTHRIDAWRLGFVNKKLDSLTQQDDYQVNITQYGVVEKLRQSKTTIKTALPKEFNNKKNLHSSRVAPVVVAHSDSNELIHAPSHDHAVVAGVLKSGYNLSKRSSAKDNNLCAVNLNSRRVRNALHLVEATRQGQDIATYLGFRLERFLHDHNLDSFIYPLRRSYPYAAPATPGNQISEAEKEVQVVDGMAILLKFREDGFYGSPVADWPDWALAALELKGLNSDTNDTPDTAFAGFAAALDDLDDLLDAVTDLSVAEGVYHIVRGAHVEAATVVNAIGQGKPLPEIAFTKTPVDGIAVHHKTLLHLPLLAANDYLTSSGAWGTPTLKGLLNPQLNLYCKEQLPAPDTLLVGYTLEEVNEAGEVVSTNDTVSLSELHIEPIDLVLSVNAEGGLAGYMDGALKEYMVEQNPDASVQLLVESSDTASVLKRSFLMKKIMHLLENSKPVVSSVFDDVASEDVKMSLVLDRAELAARLNKVITYIRAENRFSAEQSENITFAYTKLLDLLDDHQVLEASLVEAVNGFSSMVTATPFDLYLQYSTGYANDFYPDRSYVNKESGNTGMMQMESWLASISKVRTQMMNLNQLSLLQYHQKGVAHTIEPKQFPAIDQWLGGELTRGLTVDELDMSFVMINAINEENKSNDGRVVALVVDEWIEVLPHESQTTGVALHVDQPDAAPPQTLLLAVPPDTEGDFWTHLQMVGVVNSALEMAKVRLLQPHDLYDTSRHPGSRLALSQVLPGMSMEMEPDNGSNYEHGTLSVREISDMKVTTSTKTLLGAALRRAK